MIISLLVSILLEDSPVYDMYTTLEAIVEFAFAATSCKDLGFDDELIGTLKEMSTNGGQTKG